MGVSKTKTPEVEMAKWNQASNREKNQARQITQAAWDAGLSEAVAVGPCAR